MLTPSCAILYSKCFGDHVQSIEQMEALLLEEGSAWALQTLQLLRKMAPTSLKLSLAQLRRGKALDLKGCLKMEFRMMMHCMKAGDFREGIRAALVHKDGKPTWQPSSLEQVSDAAIEAYFQSLGEYELTVD
jgi:enoyl-CoA hydratase/carnithine racemase